MDRDDYLDALDRDRRAEVERLDALIREALPDAEPGVGHGMLGYGPYHYRYASGREGNWMLVGLASNKNYISLYVTATVDDRYLAETFKPRLPKASIGKSCIRIKRVSDVDPEVLAELLRAAAANPPGDFVD